MPKIASGRDSGNKVLHHLLKRYSESVDDNPEMLSTRDFYQFACGYYDSDEGYRSCSNIHKHLDTADFRDDLARRLTVSSYRERFASACHEALRGYVLREDIVALVKSFGAPLHQQSAETPAERRKRSRSPSIDRFHKSKLAGLPHSGPDEPLFGCLVASSSAKPSPTLSASKAPPRGTDKVNRVLHALLKKYGMSRKNSKMSGDRMSTGDFYRFSCDYYESKYGRLNIQDVYRFLNSKEFRSVLRCRLTDKEYTEKFKSACYEQLQNSLGFGKDEIRDFIDTFGLVDGAKESSSRTLSSDGWLAAPEKSIDEPEDMEAKANERALNIVVKHILEQFLETCTASSTPTTSELYKFACDYYDTIGGRKQLLKLYPFFDENEFKTEISKRLKLEEFRQKFVDACDTEQSPFKFRNLDFRGLIHSFGKSLDGNSVANVDGSGQTASSSALSPPNSTARESPASEMSQLSYSSGPSEFPKIISFDRSKQVNRVLHVLIKQYGLSCGRNSRLTTSDFFKYVCESYKSNDGRRRISDVLRFEDEDEFKATMRDRLCCEEHRLKFTSACYEQLQNNLKWTKATVRSFIDTFGSRLDKPSPRLNSYRPTKPIEATQVIKHVLPDDPSDDVLPLKFTSVDSYRSSRLSSSSIGALAETALFSISDDARNTLAVIPDLSTPSNESTVEKLVIEHLLEMFGMQCNRRDQYNTAGLFEFAKTYFNSPSGRVSVDKIHPFESPEEFRLAIHNRLCNKEHESGFVNACFDILQNKLRWSIGDTRKVSSSFGSPLISIESNGSRSTEPVSVMVPVQEPSEDRNMKSGPVDPWRKPALALPDYTEPTLPELSEIQATANYVETISFQDENLLDNDGGSYVNEFFAELEQKETCNVVDNWRQTVVESETPAVEIPLQDISATSLLFLRPPPLEKQLYYYSCYKETPLPIRLQ